MSPHDPHDARWSYSPEEDDQVTHLYRRAADEEELAGHLLASLTPDDGRRPLISFRHQREFLTRRKVRRFGGE